MSWECCIWRRNTWCLHWLISASSFLGENLDATNVFSILPFAEKYEARNLMAICWKLLDKESEDAFKSDAFSTIERSLLEVVVKRDTLNIKEINLFFAIDKWARKACERQGLIARGKVKRRILGENVVKEIRFPVMTFYEFAKFVIDCQILTQKEVSYIVKYFASCLDTQVGFPEFHRAGPIVIKFQRCCRFNSVVFVAPGGGYSPGRRDCLLFEVTRDIILHGLILCGRKNERYSVTVQISDLYSAIHEETGCFLSTCFQPSCQTRPYYGFEVLFSNPIVIPKQELHRVEASISGAYSYSGQKGRARVFYSDVTFIFDNSFGSSNGTTVGRGQFPEFLFTVK